MPRVAVHHHPCQSCGAKTECPGAWEENYDGIPEVICAEFHQLTAGNFDINPDFVCDACVERADADDAARLASELEFGEG